MTPPVGLDPTSMVKEPGSRLARILRETLTQNLGLKFVSLILAITVVLLVNADQDREIVARVGVSYLLPEDKALVSERVEEVRVTVRGPWRRIRRFDDRAIERIQIDLTHGSGAEVPITADLVRLPRGLDVVDISPRSIRVAFERRERKRVDVAPTLSGRALHGFIARGAVAEPAQVEVRGAEGAIDALSAVRTQEVRLDGRSERFAAQVALILPDGIEVTPSGPVTVTVEIGEELVTRQLPPSRVAIEPASGSPDRFAADPAEVRIILTGGLRAVEKTLEMGIRPVARPTAMAADRATSTPIIVTGVPPGVGVETVPASVVVRQRPPSR